MIPEEYSKEISTLEPEELSRLTVYNKLLLLKIIASGGEIDIENKEGIISTPERFIKRSCVPKFVNKLILIICKSVERTRSLIKNI